MNIYWAKLLDPSFLTTHENINYKVLHLNFAESEKTNSQGSQGGCRERGWKKALTTGQGLSQAQFNSEAQQIPTGPGLPLLPRCQECIWTLYWVCVFSRSIEQMGWASDGYYSFQNPNICDSVIPWNAASFGFITFNNELMHTVRHLGRLAFQSSQSQLLGGQLWPGISPPPSAPGFCLKHKISSASSSILF